MNTLINIFINGTWDTAHEDSTDKSPIRIFDKGTHVQILADQYDQYIDALEEKGYDCYLCPEMYSHPQWNGEIIYIKDTITNEPKKAFEDLISLYDVADDLENNGQDEDAIKMRTKLNSISNFFVKNFKKDLDNSN
jgi:hypothetical protein